VPPEILDPEVDPTLETDPAPAGASGALSPDAVRNSPEYKELARQNRALARQAGTASAAEQRARSEAERVRAAAEAESEAALALELQTSLGEDGVAAFNEIAELSATDPRAAARKMAALIAEARAQNPAAGAATSGQPAPAPEGNVPPAPTPRGMDAGAPLVPPATTDPDLATADALEARYAAVVARNTNPATRNRVTMKERAEGLISYLGASVLRAGAKPKGG
jgi:hypothetical protein